MKSLAKFRKRVFPALFMVTLFLFACYGGGGGGGGGGGTIAVTGVSLKSSTSLLPGGNEQLVAAVTPINATNKDVTWQSMDENIALVNSSGVVTGVNTGNTIIRVTTDDGGYIADCMVTVTPNPVAVKGVSLNKTSINLYVNSSDQLTASVMPSNATNQNVTWSSLNSSIASVNSTGFVTGISTGTTKVRATTADGYFQAECTVTVSEPGISADDLTEGLTAFINAQTGVTTDNGSDSSNPYHVYIKTKNDNSSVRFEYEYVSDCSGIPLWGEGSYIFNKYTDSNGVIINGTLSYYIVYDGDLSKFTYVFTGTLNYSGTVNYDTEYNYMLSFDGSAMTYGGYWKIGSAYYSYNTNGSLATTPVTVMPSFTPPTKPTTEGCVKQFNLLGSKEFCSVSSDTDYNLYLTDDNKPVIAFFDSANGNKPSVMQYSTGSGWSYIGEAGINPNSSSIYSYHGSNIGLHYLGDGNPILIFSYSEKYNSAQTTTWERLCIAKFNGSTWNSTLPYPNDEYRYITLTTDAQGNILIVVYVIASAKYSLMKYDVNNSTMTTVIASIPTHSSGAKYIHISIGRDNKIYILYYYAYSSMGGDQHGIGLHRYSNEYVYEEQLFNNKSIKLNYQPSLYHTSDGQMYMYLDSYIYKNNGTEFVEYYKIPKGNYMWGMEAFSLSTDDIPYIFYNYDSSSSYLKVLPNTSLGWQTEITQDLGYINFPKLQIGTDGSKYVAYLTSGRKMTVMKTD